MPQIQRSSNRFKLRITHKTEVYALEAEGEIQGSHPKIILVGLAKIVSDGHRRLILDLTKVRGMKAPFIMEIAAGCKNIHLRGGMIFIVGLDLQSKTLISRSPCKEWVHLESNLERAIKFLKKMEEPNLNVDQLRGYVGDLRNKVEQLDLDKGRELRRKNAFLIQRVEDMTILLKLWETDIPKEGNLPSPSSLFRAESGLMKRVANSGLMPKQFYREVIERWEEIKDDLGED